MNTDTSEQPPTPEEMLDAEPLNLSWRDEIGALWVAMTGRREFWLFGEPHKVVRYVRLERARLTVQFAVLLWISWHAYWIAEHAHLLAITEASK